MMNTIYKAGKIEEKRVFVSIHATVMLPTWIIKKDSENLFSKQIKANRRLDNHLKSIKRLRRRNSLASEEMKSLDDIGSSK